MDSGGVDIMRGLTLALLVVILLLSGACGASLVPVPPPNLDGVEEALGYSLAPTHMPEGFEFDQYDVNETAGIATISYVRFHDFSYQEILIMYPLSFSLSISDNPLLESLLLNWQRPDDAVSEVKVNGETAYLVRGSWSADSLMMLVNPDPEFLATYTPEWDYDMYQSLYCDYTLPSDETVGVMIRANFNSSGITAKEMVKIAESLQRVD